MSKKTPPPNQIGPVVVTDPPSNGSSNDDETQPGVVLAHSSNRELLAIVGNLALEAKEHSLRLDTLYEMLKEFQAPAPTKWAAQLLDTFESHHKRTGENVESLKSFVGAAGGK